MQELNSYFTASTSTSVVVDKSSDGEFLRIEFNFRYDLVMIITLLMYIGYSFYLFWSTFQNTTRTAVRAHITVCVEQLEIKFDSLTQIDVMWFCLWEPLLLISLNNHLFLVMKMSSSLWRREHFDIRIQEGLHDVYWASVAKELNFKPFYFF